MVLPGAQAAETSSALYEDPTDKFTISVPTGWATGEGGLSGNSGFSGASGTRRAFAFFPDDPAAHDVNVTVVVTNVSVEFTKLGSFGNVDTFATNLINSLDRSYLLRSKVPVLEPIQIAELVNYSASGGDAYNVEYTIQKLPGPQRHLYSTVVLGSNGRYNRLYTVTAQCLAEDLPRYQVALTDTLRSFKANLQPSY